MEQKWGLKNCFALFIHIWTTKIVMHIAQVDNRHLIVSKCNYVILPYEYYMTQKF